MVFAYRGDGVEAVDGAEVDLSPGGWWWYS